MSRKYKIGITLGDINGIGPEVILKTLSEPKVLNSCIPIIYGSGKVLGYHKNILKDSTLSFVTVSSPKQAQEGKISVINTYHETVNINLGQATAEAGKFAYVCLDSAVNDLHNGAIDGLVTGPINKKAMSMADFPEKGHTEYIAKKVGDEEPLMFMVSDDLKIAIVTAHISVKEVAPMLSKSLIKEKVMAMNNSLIQDFGYDKPLIAILGLNPHAGDEGTIGEEEEEFIKPLISELKESGLLVTGPHSADGFFGNGEYSKYDGILAMYHDQGLIPFKALCFGQGVNYTAGLHVIRTSPDHGTGFEIAGNNEADPASFRSALYTALDIIRNRNEHIELKKNALQKGEGEKLKEKSGRRNSSSE